MKMTYHLKSSVRSGRPSFVRVVTILILVLVLASLSFLPPIRNLAINLARPFWDFKTAAWRGFEVDSSLLESKQSLIIQAANLQEQIQNLNITLLEFNRITAENLELKNLLGRKEIGRTEILTRVISGPNQTPFDTILIDRGSNSGIAIGDRIVALSSVPIAEITEVFESTARATLFSFPGKSADVLIGGSGVITTAIGRGGGNFEAKLPREVEIRSGDSIVIPEIDLHVFAVVEDVLLKPTDSFQTIYFKNPINISELDWIIVNKIK